MGRCLLGSGQSWLAPQALRFLITLCHREINNHFFPTGQGKCLLSGTL